MTGNPNLFRLGRGTIYLLAVMLVFSIAAAEANNPGDQDPTFGISGIVTTDIFGFQDRAHDVAIQPDGKYLVSGDSVNASGT